MLISIRNDFHNKKVKVNSTSLQNALCALFETGKAPTYLRYVWNKLCGVQGCACGGVVGERGWQEKEAADILGNY